MRQDYMDTRTGQKLKRKLRGRVIASAAVMATGAAAVIAITKMLGTGELSGTDMALMLFAIIFVSTLFVLSPIQEVAKYREQAESVTAGNVDVTEDVVFRKWKKIRNYPGESWDEYYYISTSSARAVQVDRTFYRRVNVGDSVEMFWVNQEVIDVQLKK